MKQIARSISSSQAYEVGNWGFFQSLWQVAYLKKSVNLYLLHTHTHTHTYITTLSNLPPLRGRFFKQHLYYHHEMYTNWDINKNSFNVILGRHFCWCPEICEHKKKPFWRVSDFLVRRETIDSPFLLIPNNVRFYCWEWATHSLHLHIEKLWSGTHLREMAVSIWYWVSTDFLFPLLRVQPFQFSST